MFGEPGTGSKFIGTNGVLLYYTGKNLGGFRGG